MDITHFPLISSLCLSEFNNLCYYQDEGGDSPQERRPKRRARTLEYYKMRFRKNLTQLLEEEADKMMIDDDLEDGGDTDHAPVLGYLAAQVPVYILPQNNVFLLSKANFEF